MLKITLPLTACLLISCPLSAHADACDDTAARIAAAVPGLTFEARVDPKPQSHGIVPSPTVEVRFQHKFGGTVEIFCNPYVNPVVTVDTNTVYPSREFIALAAKIGAAETGVSADTIRKGLLRTHRAALRGDAETDANVGSANVMCVVFKDTDPKNTTFEIKRR